MGPNYSGIVASDGELSKEILEKRKRDLTQRRQDAKERTGFLTAK